jgi:hypothetical protein
VPDQVLHTEAHPRRIETFDGPVRNVSIVRRQAALTYTPCCAELESSPRSVWSFKTPSTMAEPSTYADFTTAEEQALYRPYAKLPAPPDGYGEDIGVDINPHFPHFPPDPLSIDCSVCGQDEERYDDLPPLPDSPLAIAKFGFISRESFNTSVRGLVQEEPDSPIGGYWAAPMQSRVHPGRVDLGRENLDGARHSGILLPQIEITSPATSLRSEEGPIRQPLVPHSTFSDPFVNAIKKDKQIQQSSDLSDSDVLDSVYTTAIVTAQDTPVRRENTDMSHDGARASNAENNNENESNLPLLDCCISPTDRTDSEAVEVYDLNGMPRAGSKSYVSQAPFGTSRSGNLPNTGYGLSGDVPITRTGVGRTDFANRPGFKAPTLNASGLPNPDISDSNGTIPVPAVNVHGVSALPLDTTGSFPAPELPEKAGKRQKAANKGKRGIRKCRRVVMRRPFLVLLLGRQLAGPTKDALKLISKGVPVQPDVGGLTEAAGIPAPDGASDVAPAPPPLPAPM